MADQPSPKPEPNPPTNPTIGRNAGYHLDDKGNVTGIWFTVNVNHFIEFNDQAIDLTPGARDSDKPTA